MNSSPEYISEFGGKSVSELAGGFSGIQTIHIPTARNTADIFTKPLNKVKFVKHRDGLTMFRYMQDFTLELFHATCHEVPNNYTMAYEFPLKQSSIMCS